MSADDRVRWRCRRGLLELDLVLGGFLRDGYEQLDASERAAFARMLEADDNDLWDWVSGRGEPPDQATFSLIERLRTVRVKAA